MGSGWNAREGLAGLEFHTSLVAAAAAMLLSQCACAGHSVKFVPIVHFQIPRVDHAVAIDGSIDEAKTLWEKAALPHNTVRQRYEVFTRGFEKLTDQLGSKDYFLVGEVLGGGNAWANQSTLTEALCRKAASKGGDVVLIYRRGTTKQPYVYSTPSVTTSNVRASAYSYGNYISGHGTSRTTYSPGTTYAGVYIKPNANGLVFRHLPGVESRLQRLMALDDAALARIDSLYQTLAPQRRLTLAEVLSQVDSAISKEQARHD